MLSSTRERVIRGGERMKHVTVDDRKWIKDFEGLAGVDACVLWSKPNGGATLLVRIAKGATIPLHKHKNYEETYVVAGRVDVGNGVIAAGGDYVVLESTEDHQLRALEDTTSFVSIESGLEWIR